MVPALGSLRQVSVSGAPLLREVSRECGRRADDALHIEISLVFAEVANLVTNRATFTIGRGQDGG